MRDGGTSVVIVTLLFIIILARFASC